MQDVDPRRLRRAVAQLSACADEDVAWIMGTLTPAQRERLTVLVEEGLAAPEHADAAEHRIDALLQTAGPPLAARFRLALNLPGGEGRLTALAREALAAATREVAMALPPPSVAVVAPTGLGALFARLRRGLRR